MSDPPDWTPVPLVVTTDLHQGGRWTSLRGGGREWLWTNPDQTTQRLRRLVQPGNDFVDAGGVEEVLPTVRGRPDHNVWTRSWAPLAEPGTGEVDCRFGAGPGSARGRLRRRLRSVAGSVQADYDVLGPPGAAFVHAVYALLHLAEGARLEPRPGFQAVVLPEAAGGRERSLDWPSGLDPLGSDDGTATCVLLRGCRGVDVTDGADRLTMTWSADLPEMCSLLFWRNLGGWPSSGPYRSIGVEPMVGRVADYGRARPGQPVRLSRSGSFRWSLMLTATRRDVTEVTSG